MSLPPGTKIYRLDATGEEFYWSGTEQRYVFRGSGRRLTAAQLQELAATQGAQVQPGVTQSA